MPDGLEYLVRPYTAPNAHGAVIIPSTPTSSRDRATITWGATATMPDVATGEGFNVVCCKDSLTEESRTSDQKRIYQNNDSSSQNWVDVQRPATMKLKKKEANSCGDNWDDMSEVAQAVDASIAEFQSMVLSGTAARPDKNCAQDWKFTKQ